MKKILLVLLCIFILCNLTGCSNKGDVTITKILEVETLTHNYIKFIDNKNQYYYNDTWFEKNSTIKRIQNDKIKEGDILKVRFSYYAWWAEDSILDYEVLIQKQITDIKGGH